MLRVQDKDTQVITNAIHALNEILSSEGPSSSSNGSGGGAAHRSGGMVINHAIMLYLLNRIKEFNEWGQRCITCVKSCCLPSLLQPALLQSSSSACGVTMCCLCGASAGQCLVLELAAKYTPRDENAVFDVMNLLEDRLKHSNSAVVLGTTKVFLHYTTSMPKVHEEVYKRLKAPLLTLMTGGSHELSFAILAHIHILVTRSPNVFRDRSAAAAAASSSGGPSGQTEFS